MLAVLLSGCATGPALQPATYQLPKRVELTNVPFYPQEKYQCGPAALATALNYAPAAKPRSAAVWKAPQARGRKRDTHITAKNLVPQVFIPGRDGSVQPEMLATARRHERIAYPVRPTLDALLAHVADGYPVVVMQNLSLPVWPMWHYAVVIGYDLGEESLILRSGETRRHRVSFRRFDATWARSQRWGFVLARPGRIPSGITPRRAVQAISDYQALHGIRAALSSWQALTQAQPHNAMAHFGLGNAYYEQQALQKSALAFQRATAADAALGVAWLNLGLVNRELGRMNRARKALEKAAELDSTWQEKARTALETL
ncbi:PA2778 family cysteine peptidase [Halomonas cibimaris]|uniref:PA2778 family cysteine peptidase n=1 Tax=Halomonas cibimaris TaxID=657012 RepID=A0ABP7LXX3_9GAMM